jgi:hypothetical protein
VVGALILIWSDGRSDDWRNLIAKFRFDPTLEPEASGKEAGIPGVTHQMLRHTCST